MLGLNFAGIQSVGHGSSAFMILLLTPFVVITLIAFTGVFTGTTVLGWPFSVANMLCTKSASEVQQIFFEQFFFPCERNITLNPKP